MNFTYYDNEGNEYERWDSSKGESKGKLPTIMAIMLKFNNKMDANKPFNFMTAVALPLARNDYKEDLHK
jgi:hypothetical protein